MGQEEREGAVAAIGAVSPPGGDLSEPVTQATLRIVKVFWGLDAALAYRRHFPAINWLNSYSLYRDRLDPWFTSCVSEKWSARIGEMMRILQLESELDEIVKLVGMDALSPSDRMTLEIARSIREDYLQQDAFDPGDSYTSLEKQTALADLILTFGDKARLAIAKGADVEKIAALPVREKIGRAKSVAENAAPEIFAAILKEAEEQLDALTAREETV